MECFNNSPKKTEFQISLKSRMKRQIHTPLPTDAWPAHRPGLAHTLQHIWWDSTSLLDPNFPFREMILSCVFST